MRPFVIDDNFRAEMKRLLDAPRISVAEMRLYEFTGHSPGDDPRYVAELPFGFRVVYTTEEHPLKNETGTVWLRHMSVSVKNWEGKLPNPFTVDCIAAELLFPELENCMLQLDQDHKPPRFIEVIAELDKCPTTARKVF